MKLLVKKKSSNLVPKKAHRWYQNAMKKVIVLADSDSASQQFTQACYRLCSAVVNHSLLLGLAEFLAARRALAEQDFIQPCQYRAQKSGPVVRQAGASVSATWRNTMVMDLFAAASGVK